MALLLGEIWPVFPDPIGFILRANGSFKRPLETIREFKAAAGKDWVLPVVGAPTGRLPAKTVQAACWEPDARAVFKRAQHADGASRSLSRSRSSRPLVSHGENFSHVTAETLAYGVRCFLSRGVDLRRDLAHIDCCFVMEGGLDDEISPRTAWTRVLGMDRGELAAAGQRGRDWIRKELSQHRFVERVKDLCAGMVNPSPVNNRYTTASGAVSLAQPEPFNVPKLLAPGQACSTHSNWRMNVVICVSCVFSTS